MQYNFPKYHRRSIRLPDYDYSQVGAYFITICTHKHKCLFGEIANEKMMLNDYGRIIYNEWVKTAEIRENISLNGFVIMPNHIHGIITIDYYISQRCRALMYERYGKPAVNSIPTIIRSFKATTTKQINAIRDTPGFPLWQRNYYEHVIRNDKSWYLVSEYIQNNVLQWVLDEYNPNKICRG